MITTTYLKNTWLGLSSDSSQDTLLEELIAVATGKLEAWCGQPLVEVTGYVTAIPSIGHTTHHLPFALVPLAITALEYRATPLDSWTAATAGTYAVHKDKAGWWLYSSDGLVEPYYQMTSTVGYPVASMPEVLQWACGYVAKELFNASAKSGKADRFGLASISDANPSGSVALAITSVAPEVRDAIKPWNVRLRL